MRVRIHHGFRKAIGVLLLLSSAWFIVYYFIDSTGKSLGRNNYIMLGSEITAHECYLYGKRDRAKGLHVQLTNRSVNLELPIWVECEIADSTNIKSLAVSGRHVIRWGTGDSDYIELEKGIEYANTKVWLLFLFSAFMGLVFLFESRVNAFFKYLGKNKV